jgi:hypothetical protein
LDALGNVFRLTSACLVLALSCLSQLLGCATAQQPTLGDDSTDPGGGANSAGGSGSSAGGRTNGGSSNSSGASSTSTGGAPGKGGATGASGATGSAGSAQGGSSTSGGAAAGGAASAGAPSAGATSKGGAASGGAASGGATSKGGAASGGATSGGATGAAGSSAAGAGGASGTVLFSDDFEDGSTTGWVTSGSGATWAITTDGTKVYAQTAQAGSTLLVSAAGSMSWTDQVVQARVKINAFSGMSTSYDVGIFARYNGTGYYSLIVHTDGSVAIRKDKTTLGNATAVGVVAVGTWYTLRLSVVGSTLTGYVNDVLQLTETDSSYTSGQMAVSMQSATAEFDDVKVTSP